MFSSREATGLCCDPTPVGHSWTLTSAMGHLLAEAEGRYGARDRSFTPIGLEFTSADVPQTWFPGSREFVAIQLTESARQNPNRALFQLAHEVIHLLAPNIGITANVLEEGLATLFSDEMSMRYGWGYQTDILSYREAKAAVQAIIAFEADAIRRLRAVQPNFYLMDADLLSGILPAVPRSIAEAVCMTFSR